MLEAFKEQEGVPFKKDFKGREDFPCDILEHLIQNFMVYKNICASSIENVIEINNLLFTGDFLKDVKEIAALYNPLWELIEGSTKNPLFKSTREILKLKIPEIYKVEYEAFIDKALTPIALLSFALDPRSKATNLLEKKHEPLFRKPIFKGFDKAATKKALAFFRFAHPFNSRNDLDPITYWEFFTDEDNKGLSNIALKLCKLPSSSYSGPYFLGHEYTDDFETINKILTILIDSNQ